MSLYFEDFTLGRSFLSPAPRTVSDKTVRDFAEVSGDKNRLHLDEDFARSSPFGGRIAHGLLGLSIASGLLHELGIIAETVVAFAALDWKFKGPILIGDAISMRMAVVKARPHGPDKGLVLLEAELKNQDGKLIQAGSWSLWVKRRGVSA